MLKASRLACAAAGLAASAAMAGQPAGCKLMKAGEFQIEMRGTQPLVDATINGHAVKMMIDTGGAASVLPRRAAASLGLTVHQVEGLKFYGVGGSDTAGQTVVRDFRLGDYAAKDVRFLVTGWRSFSDDESVVGVIGEDFLSQVDLEFNLSDGMIRLFKPKDCKGDQVVYWMKPYSLLEIVHNSSDSSPLVYVTLNGQRVLAELDSGASVSTVTPAAARRAGVEQLALDEGSDTRMTGLGTKSVGATYAIFPTLTIGDETVKNAKLLVADMFGMNEEVHTGSRIAEKVMSTPDMLLGGDFLRSHRVYLARDQAKIYFSYEGGPIFRLPTAPAPAPEPTEEAPAAGAPAPAPNP